MLTYPLGVSLIKSSSEVKGKMGLCRTNLEMSSFYQFRNVRFSILPDQPLLKGFCHQLCGHLQLFFFHGLFFVVLLQGWSAGGL